VAGVLPTGPVASVNTGPAAAELMTHSPLGSYDLNANPVNPTRTVWNSGVIPFCQGFSPLYAGRLCFFASTGGRVG
jgi:hypothetical protein